MALYTVRSERMFCEQLDYNLLFRWFLDLNWDKLGFDHSSFSRNRGRLLAHDVAGEFFRTVVAEARELKLTSDEHFTVDGADRGLGVAQELAPQGRGAERAHAAR